jgi:2-polyprenyl-6-methoxyphenol hydroxylase-like FAD-dependent oxidoreductase
MEPIRHSEPRRLSCRCCIAGAGPAGLMLGFLLARAGVDTIVVEKHDDFLRDFRGDTIHASTLEAMCDLGLYENFLRLPHAKVQYAELEIGGRNLRIADFSHLPTRAKFIAFMPQWDFLDFLAARAKRFSTFRLLMGTKAENLIIREGRIAGIMAEDKDGPLAIEADLTIGADGRHSQIREAAGFVPRDIGAPMDVFWFRLARGAEEPEAVFGRIDAGQILVRFSRGSYWQCAYVIPKGSAEKIYAEGIVSLRQKLAKLAPALKDRLGELSSFDKVKLLTVKVDRLPLWHKPGLVCIGDAAHAMSPIGGVGINLAIQDAIATANLLAPALAEGKVLTQADLAKVQKRREWPAKATQAIQVFIQNRLISKALDASEAIAPPLLMRLLDAIPALRRIPAYMIGIGLRPERVKTREAVPPSSG